MTPQTETTTTRTGSPTRRFILHYVEMVAVMFAGMVVLGAPAGWLMHAAGTSWSRLSPAMMLFGMTVTMAVPMAAWMRYRGHAWRPNAEMAGSMFLPTFALMAASGAGVAKGMPLMVVEHAAMLACMLVAMLLRREEYACAAGHGPGRPGRPSRPGRPGRPGRSSRPDRPGRSSHAGRPDRPGRPAGAPPATAPQYT
jgi:hypothetical protein